VSPLLKICDIVAGHIKGHRVERIILTGGTCCLPGSSSFEVPLLSLRFFQCVCCEIILMTISDFTIE